METIKDRVRSARMALRMTQAELAAAVGTSQQSIQQLEDGEVRKPRYILDLARALRVDPHYLQHGGTARPADRKGVIAKDVVWNVIYHLSATSPAINVDPSRFADIAVSLCEQITAHEISPNDDVFKFAASQLK